MIILETMDHKKYQSKMEQIIELYSDVMHLQAVSILQNNEDAQDAVQTAMIKICKHIKKLQDPCSNRTKWYVLEATKNAAIDIYRKRKRRWQNETPLDETIASEEAMPRYLGEKETVRQIMELSLQDRNILMLKYVYGYDYAEIAQALGISKEAAKKAGQRAKERLKKTLEKEATGND